LSEQTWREMTRPREVAGRGLRTLGWDNKTGYSTNRGNKLSSAAFGHGGFTGTSLWIDPSKDLYVGFLSNRLHPDGKGAVNPLAGRIADLVTESLANRHETNAGEVR
jgi:CubicO group peptidase (beta-lactamase class C family)